MPDIFDEFSTERPKSSKRDIFDEIAEHPIRSVFQFDEIAEHPIRSVFQPLSKTLGGPSVAEVIERTPIGGVNPFVKAAEEGGGAARQAIAFGKSYASGLAGDIFDLIQTPGSYIPIPGAKIAGKAISKIPVGQTTLGRVVKLPVTKKFLKDVKELSRYEEELKRILPLSSKGITDVAIKDIIEKAGGDLLQIQPAADVNNPFGEPAIWYNTPSGSTQLIRLSEFTLERVKSKIDTFETAFRRGEFKKSLEIAKKKMIMQTQVESVRTHLGEKANNLEIAARLNKLETKNKLTAKEEQALVEDITGQPSPPPVPPHPSAGGTEIPQKPFAPIVKERKFFTSMKESPKVSLETKTAIEALPENVRIYEPYSDEAALNKARQTIDADPNKALSDVLMNENPDKDTGTTGIELMRRFREAGNIETEVAIAKKLAVALTRSGQFIQSASILNKLSPEGMLVLSARELGEKLTPELAAEIKAKILEVQKLPYGWLKIKGIREILAMISEAKGRTMGDWIVELMNVPRTLIASLGDFSFGFRQGSFLLPSFTKEWAGAFKKQFGSAFYEQQYDDLMDSIVKHPEFKLATESGIAFTELSGKGGLNLKVVEERFMGGRLVEKIPIIGQGVVMTERGYNAMANKMRMDVFSSINSDLRKIGKDLRINPRLAKQVAEFVNAGTGRGGLGRPFADAAELLNALFFSPQLMSSRLKLLNPVYYVTREPGLRKQAVKSLFSFLGLGTTILTVAAGLGAEVGLDSRSADFGKIKMGKNKRVRIDVWGGFQSYVRMLAQQISGQYVSSTTGRILTLGEGYKSLSRYDIFARQVESKEAPIFSLMTEILKQQNWNGEPMNVPKAVAQRFFPMIIQDMYDIAKEEPEIIPMGLLSIFGFGVNAYSNKKTELVREGVRRVANKENIIKVSREIARKLDESPTREKVSDIHRQILQEQVVKNNPYYIEIISAGSSEKKIEIIKKMRQKYSPSEMRKYEREIFKSKMATAEIIIKSRK